MNLVAVVGARPNFVKIAPILGPLEAAGVSVRIAHTGQHYDPALSDVFFRDLELPQPDWNLAVGSGSHATQTGTAMIGLERLFIDEHPDAVMVIGDVNSTLAGALAAAKLHIPVVHLEAGFRSFDRRMPEEINRVLTDHVSDLLLAPSTAAIANLEREGIAGACFVGNIMAEAVLRFAERIPRQPGFEKGSYILATIHRAENTRDAGQLARILAGLGDGGLPVILPAHPRTRPLLTRVPPNVRVVDPVGYLEMLGLQSAAAVVATDSGGVQEEACVLGTPCVTIRTTTEHVETLEIGANRLVEASEEAISAALAAALASERGWELPARWDLEVSARVAESVVGLLRARHT